MPRSCSICKRPFEKENGSFFRVPSNVERRHRWSVVCGIEFSQTARVCQRHFRSSDFVNPPGDPYGPLRLQPGAVPQLACPDIAVCFPTPDLSFQDAEVLPPSSVNSSMQTENNEYEGYKINIIILKEEVKQLQAELAKSKADLEEANKILNSVFTPDQIRKLKYPDMCIRWSWKDISNAIVMQAAGPKAYNHLYNKGYPLPHISTLQRWSRKVNMQEGILSFAIDCMQNNTNLSEADKLCVISFDEMKVAAVYEHDPMVDAVREPANYVQMVMVRGLKASWKQPIFYGFDCKMTKKILSELICTLRKATFTVVAVVSDMGPTNQALWKELDVSIQKSWFVSPVDVNEKVFVFADAPHLLKLIRNHFLDTGLLWADSILSPTTLKEVINYAAGSDLSITYKLNEEHLTVRGAGRQKVKYAAQLFSHTTASAIRRCYVLGKELYKPVETAEFIQLINDWFDVLNSKMTTFNFPGKKPYGRDIDYQEEILRRMDLYMSKPIVPNKMSLAPFQKGVLITNASLRLLYAYITQRTNMEYICTYRLNQDVLEHFFSAIRSKGGLYDHPSPKSFTYRLRKYILARNTQLLNSTGNVEGDNTQWISSTDSFLEPRMAVSSDEENEVLNFMKFSDDDVDLSIMASALDMELVDFQQSSTIAPNSTADISLISTAENSAEEFPQNVPIDHSGDDEFDTLHEDALEYVAGYVIKKLKLSEFVEEKSGTFTYVDEISKGGLQKPCEPFLNKLKGLETIFNQINGDRINGCKSFQSFMLSQSYGVELPERVKKFFFKCRMHFRIKHLNRRLQIQKAKQKVMGNKKLVKIKL